MVDFLGIFVNHDNDRLTNRQMSYRDHMMHFEIFPDRFVAFPGFHLSKILIFPDFYESMYRMYRRTDGPMD